MDEVDVSRGRFLTCAAILTAGVVFVVLLTYEIAHSKSWYSPMWLLFPPGMLIALHLYRGATWAKWAIAAALVLFGVSGTIPLFTGRQFPRGVLPNAWLALMIASLGLALSLLLSRDVRTFLEHQRRQRLVAIARILVVGWLLCAIGLAVYSYVDVTRVLLK